MSANKILIADDDRVVHESLGIYLKAEGYDTVDVYDGKAAVEALDGEIALCVLDIPGMKESVLGWKTHGPQKTLQPDIPDPQRGGSPPKI